MFQDLKNIKEKLYEVYKDLTSHGLRDMLNPQNLQPDTWYAPYLERYTNHVLAAARARKEEKFVANIEAATKVRSYAELYSFLVPPSFTQIPLERFNPQAILAEYPKLQERMALWVFKTGKA